MEKDDLIYKGDTYEIYKKDSGVLGDFTPISLLELIDICINELEKYDNAGFKNKSDYCKIINEITQRLVMLQLGILKQEDKIKEPND